MTYRIDYGSLFDAKSLRRLSRQDLLKIHEAMEEKLTRRPDLFGKPLRRSLRGYRSLRVGDYRVVYRIEKSTVHIFAVEHRSTIYAVLERRLLG